MEEHRQVVDSALTVGFCLMKRREADSAAVMYLESRQQQQLQLWRWSDIDMIVSGRRSQYGSMSEEMRGGQIDVVD